MGGNTAERFAALMQCPCLTWCARRELVRLAVDRNVRTIMAAFDELGVAYDRQDRWRIALSPTWMQVVHWSPT
ncbi:hypothetical protein ACWENQ_40915 [Nonomuraea sp. NPDC004354]